MRSHVRAAAAVSALLLTSACVERTSSSPVTGLGGRTADDAPTVIAQVLPEILTCLLPQAPAVATRTIGPGGGVLEIGPHTLVIPAGALATDIAITGTAPGGFQRKLEFTPHGLHFATPVRLTMSYAQCPLPLGAQAEVVYTGADDEILARQPSLDQPGAHAVEAWTDHFSGYLVAYGRH